MQFQPLQPFLLPGLADFFPSTAMSSFLTSEEQQEIVRIQRELQLSQSTPPPTGPGAELSRLESQMITDHQGILDTLHVGMTNATENIDMPQEDWEAALRQLGENMTQESAASILSTTNRVIANGRTRNAADRREMTGMWSRIASRFMAFWRKALNWITEVLTALVDRVSDMLQSVKRCFANVASELVRLWGRVGVRI